MQQLYKNKIALMYIISAVFWGLLIIAKSFFVTNNPKALFHTNVFGICFIFQTAITHLLIKYHQTK